MTTFTIFAAKYLYLLGPFLTVVVWLRLSKTNQRSLILRAIAAAILGTVLVHIFAGEYFESRPFVRLHEVPLIAHSADNAFPSDHTLIAAACAFLLYSFSLPAAVLATIAALIVGWARVASLLHSPLDIVASFAIAAFSVFIAHVLVRRKPKTGRTSTSMRLAKSGAVSASPQSEKSTESAFDMTADRR